MQNAFINGNVVNNGNHFECHPAAKSKLFRTGNCGSDNCAKIAAMVQQQLSGQRDQFYATLSAACKAHHTSLISGCQRPGQSSGLKQCTQIVQQIAICKT